MSELLSVRGLSKVFGTWSLTHAVDDVSFAIPETPTIISLVGESGSGKSTISRIVLGLEKPTAGTVLYKGTDIFAQDQTWAQRFRREVQVVFQDPYSAFNPVHKVEHTFNVPIRRFGLAANRDEKRAMISESLRAVDLQPEEVLGKYPHQLSGGQRQRVMLARLHLIRPRLIIADEPISMIDASMQASFLNILLDFRDRLGISTLFITHDLSTARYLGDNIIVLYKGRIMEKGPTAAVTNRPQHPYARLLMQSVPIADPRRRWQQNLPAAPETAPTWTAEQAERRDRCLFAERCSYAMPACWKNRPQLAGASDVLVADASDVLVADASDVLVADDSTSEADEAGIQAAACYLVNPCTNAGQVVPAADLDPAIIAHYREAQ